MALHAGRRRVPHLQSSGRSDRRNGAASQSWWMGMFGRQVGPGRLTLASMFSLEPITRARLQSSVSSRRDPGGSADRGSAASARFSDAALSGVEHSGRHSIVVLAVTGGEPRARSGGIHAPPIGGGESVLADWSSHVRCHAHCDGRHHGRLRARTVVRRSLGLS